MSLPTRPEALALLHEWVQSESLRKHMYAVEAALRADATHFGEDEELWGITGLLHSTTLTTSVLPTWMTQ